MNTGTTNGANFTDEQEGSESMVPVAETSGGAQPGQPSTPTDSPLLLNDEEWLVQMYRCGTAYSLTIRQAAYNHLRADRDARERVLQAQAKAIDSFKSKYRVLSCCRARSSVG